MSSTGHQCPSSVLTVNLRPSQSFSRLSERQQQYATYLSLAAFAGAPVLFDQCSRNARSIHAFLAAYLKPYISAEERASVLSAVETAVGVDHRETLQHLHDYAGHFYYNFSEYLGFGDTKFVPRCSRESLGAMLQLLEGSTHKGAGLTSAFHAAQDGMYDEAPGQLSLGFHPTGCTAYYQPADFSESEAKQINDIMTEKKMMHENTHVIRHDTWYEVSLASVEVAGRGEPIGVCNGKEVCVTRGRGSAELAKACKWLEKAREFADSDAQRKMLDALVAHYKSGDCGLHKTYSEHWVQDREVVVETYQGFIETYRDPSGVRAEYEAFVACVDPEVSKTLHDLVSKAPEILPLLPYPRALEKDKFIPPVYNAINILAFPATGMPIGINIPNYDDTRRDFGFKNVSLLNVMQASSTSRTITDYIPDEVKEAYLKYSFVVLTISVALHELFGHGTTKLLQEGDVQNNISDPLDEKDGVLKTYYKEGETYSSVFGPMSNAFEECKAEATSLHLGSSSMIHQIFHLTPEDAEEVPYFNIYQMILSGVAGLIHYSVERKEWLQAHCQARYVILQACLKWAPGSIEFPQVDDSLFKIDIKKESVPPIMKAIEKLLLHIATYKASANQAGAKKLFDELSEVTQEWIDRRAILEKRRKPRMLHCGARIQCKQEGYTLVDASEGEPTYLDLAVCNCSNILLSLADK